MKRSYLLIILFVYIFSLKPTQVMADKLEFESTYNAYMEYAQNHIDTKNSDADSIRNIIDDLKNTYGDAIKLDFKTCIYIFVILLSVNIISMALISFLKNDEIAQITQFSCYCISALCMIMHFKGIADECRNGINNLTDFMSVAFPAIAGLLASGGYVATASSMQMNFTMVSVFLTKFINGFLIPLLYACGLLCIVDGISNAVNINQFITLIKKIIKYIIGFFLTVFAGMLTLTGFSGVTADNLAMRTAKYAVANFVPVVGACLSEALSSMIHSSVILKNSIGVIGFSVVLSICFYPIAKTAIYVLTFKLAASVLALISSNNTTKSAESMADILEMMMGIFLIITVVFVLVITILVSLGM